MSLVATATSEMTIDIDSGDAALVEMLREKMLFSEETIARVCLVQQESSEPLDAVMTRLGLISEQRLAMLLAEATGLDFIGPHSMPKTPVPGPILAAPFLHDLRALPISVDEHSVVVAVSNPLDNFAYKAFEFSFARSVRLVVASASDISAAIDRLYEMPADDAVDDMLLDSDDLERLKDLVSDAPVIRAANALISRAVDEGASDIHLEPTDDSLTVRLRVDGVLRQLPPLGSAMRTSLVSRIKVMAGLNIAERRLPQDGRMRTAVRGNEVDFRVATAPSIHGESVVLRILDRSKLALDFSALGFDDWQADRLQTALHRPHGIVLVTGPTGSGKTTTLYAALANLNEPGRKLLTIEDPIEYRLPGIVQAQVNPTIGLTFSTALRSFLRQDPDVMMVGEIRDTETAQVAVQAALTGHMILATLHTNTAAGAVTRLLDMGVEPFLLSSVLTGVLAQRLVRRLCVECRQLIIPDAAMLAPFGPAALRRAPGQLYRAVGCSQCSGSGFVGRVAIFEFLEVDAGIARLMLRRADSREIAAAAATSMRSLSEDGLQKAAQGLTTLEEVLRVSAGDSVA